jgi:hypothetical protein
MRSSRTATQRDQFVRFFPNTNLPIRSLKMIGADVAAAGLRRFSAGPAAASPAEQYQREPVTACGCITLFTTCAPI